MSEALPREIHTILILMGEANVLLPSAAVAEIAPLADLAKADAAPRWLLGNMPWRGRVIPVVSFPKLTEAAAQVQEDAWPARVVVLRTLDDRNGAMPYLGLLAQGLPRLTAITPDLLMRSDGGERLAPGTSAQVLVRSDQAIIPDLPWIEGKVAQALGV